MSLAQIEAFIPANRELPSWIDGFIQLTEHLQSPTLFRKWSAISAVAAAMERKVWIRSQGENLYPNLYVLLVGPPGAGKTRALAACEETFAECGTHNIAKASLTKASLMDELAEASRVVDTLPKPNDIYNSMYITSKEFGALLPSYDSDLLNALTYVYDCRKYDEKRRGNKEALVIERPQINLIGCTTPGYLVGTMPLGAWEQGFLARTLIIYQDSADIAPLHLLDETTNKDKDLAEALGRDMKKVAARVGRMAFTRSAAEAIYAWNESRSDPPTHPRLQHYVTRRTLHLLKLCMVATVDRGSETIDLSDYQRALNWLVEAEGFMPEVFAAMQSGGDAVVINEAWHFIVTYNVKTGGGCPPHMLIIFLQNRLPASSVDRVVKLMKDSKLIEERYEKGGFAYYGKVR